MTVPTHLREFDFERDYAAVLALWQAAGPGIHVSESDEPAEIARKLQRDPDLFLLAEADDQIIATVLGGFDGRRGLAIIWRSPLPGVGAALVPR